MGGMSATCPVCKQDCVVIPMMQQTPGDRGVPGVLLEGDDWSRGCGDGCAPAVAAPEVPQLTNTVQSAV